MRWPDAIQAGRTCNAVTRSIDLFPTLSALVSVEVPPERKIDGVDISPLMLDEIAEAPNDTFAYYWHGALAAIRVGDWKLHFEVSGWVRDCDGPKKKLLFNLADDVGETNNLYDQYPDIVRQLEEAAEPLRRALGDSLQDVDGSEKRPVGRVENPRPLTEYRDDHPYMIAMYDLPDMPTMAG